MEGARIRIWEEIWVMGSWTRTGRKLVASALRGKRPWQNAQKDI